MTRNDTEQRKEVLVLMAVAEGLASRAAWAEAWRAALGAIPTVGRSAARVRW
jgi:hypothetical protein